MKLFTVRSHKLANGRWVPSAVIRWAVEDNPYVIREKKLLHPGDAPFNTAGEADEFMTAYCIKHGYTPKYDSTDKTTNGPPGFCGQSNF